MALSRALIVAGITWTVVLAACGSTPGTRDSTGPAGSAVTAVATAGRAAAVPADNVEGLTVDVKGMQFLPARIEIRAGETVTWVFDDEGIPHTATAFDRSFDTGIVLSGRYAVRFDRPGTYCYQCAIHPGTNLCNPAAAPNADQPRLMLTGDADGARPAAGPAAAPLAGGGHMQGMIVVR